jgi:Aminoglycoside adenylyltransferase, C-terminal domain
MDDPHARVAELADLLDREFGDELLGLYLFGSLPAGGFVDGKSDIDLLAVLERDVDEPRLERLERLHTAFVEQHPDWSERVEVGYVSRDVLRTLGNEPSGTIALISPGQPLNIKEFDWGWALDWDAACRQGEVLRGPQPLELGPAVSPGTFRHAAAEELRGWTEGARRPFVAYMPAHQGYIVVTVCRALYTLETGGQTTKESAAAWAAARYPEWAEFIGDALAAYRADLAGRHARTIAFVDFANDEAS